jgi:hypothetical protein
MPSLYDVYPYTEDDLLEFRLMTEQPNQDDAIRLADMAYRFLDSPVSSEWSSKIHRLHSRHRGLWLPEGMVEIAEMSFLESDDHPVPQGLDISLSISSKPMKYTSYRQITIVQRYAQSRIQRAHQLGLSSGNMPLHQKADFDSPPLLFDFGIRHLDISRPSPIAEIAALRRDTLPESIDVQEGTMTEDVRRAEIKATGDEVIAELINTGEFDAIASGTTLGEPVITVPSKLTVRTLISLLQAYITKP